jgi:transcriptional regulator with XRE-family HTH domain
VTERSGYSPTGRWSSRSHRAGVRSRSETDAASQPWARSAGLCERSWWVMKSSLSYDVHSIDPLCDDNVNCQGRKPESPLPVLFARHETRRMSRGDVVIDGKKLKSIRDKMLLTQGQLADKLGVHPNWVSAAESTGRRSVLRSKLGEVADALGLKPEELLAPPEVAAETPADDESKAMRLAFDSLTDEERQRWITAARAGSGPVPRKAAASRKANSPPAKRKRS